jgi:hypothetical protein
LLLLLELPWAWLSAVACWASSERDSGRYMRLSSGQ